jgi:hypothetical protein
MKRTLLILFTIGASSFVVNAQQTEKQKLKSYRKNPHWITMMDDSSVNYNEAKLAFEEFWKGKERPEEEGHETNEKIERKSFLEKIFENNSDARKYAFEHKRFENWLLMKAPFVRLDGTIMSDDEILQMVSEELKRRTEDAVKF